MQKVIQGVLLEGQAKSHNSEEEMIAMCANPFYKCLHRHFSWTERDLNLVMETLKSPCTH